MRVVMFYHSLISDWNHGNAHFLRGIATELLARGHEVTVLEPVDAWSVSNLIAERGPAALVAYRRAYPALVSQRYDDALDLEAALDGADLVLVHEWNDPALVRRIGAHHARNRRASADPSAARPAPARAGEADAPRAAGRAPGCACRSWDGGASRCTPSSPARTSCR